jgi:hypothetical protein
VGKPPSIRFLFDIDRERHNATVGDSPIQPREPNFQDEEDDGRCQEHRLCDARHEVLGRCCGEYDKRAQEKRCDCSGDHMPL